MNVRERVLPLYTELLLDQTQIPKNILFFLGSKEMLSIFIVITPVIRVDHRIRGAQSRPKVAARRQAERD